VLSATTNLGVIRAVQQCAGNAVVHA